MSVRVKTSRGLAMGVGRNQARRLSRSSPTNRGPSFPQLLDNLPYVDSGAFSSPNETCSRFPSVVSMMALISVSTSLPPDNFTVICWPTLKSFIWAPGQHVAEPGGRHLGISGFQVKTRRNFYRLLALQYVQVKRGVPNCKVFIDVPIVGC